MKGGSWGGGVACLSREKNQARYREALENPRFEICVRKCLIALHGLTFVSARVQVVLKIRSHAAIWTSLQRFWVPNRQKNEKCPWYLILYVLIETSWHITYCFVKYIC